MEKFLIYNAIKTPDGTVLESKHRHDFLTHIDANKEYYQNDGGIDYFHRSINKVPAEDLSLYSDAPHVQIREKVSRVWRGLDRTEPLKYVLLKDINDDWLQAIIDYEELNRPQNKFLEMYKNEQIHRRLSKQREEASYVVLDGKSTKEDLEFIPVSSVFASIKQLEGELTLKASTQKRATILFTINELKQLLK